MPGSTPPGKIDALLVRLCDWLPRIQHEVRSELLAIGADAVPALIGALKREDRGAHQPAMEVLAEIGDLRAVAPLIRVVRSDASAMNRVAAVVALGALGSKRAYRPLMELLEEDDMATRDKAAEALGRLGDRRAVPALIAMLEHRDGYARAAASRGLAYLQDPRAVMPLLVSRADKWTRKRERAERALVAIGEAGVEQLRDALDDGAWYVRQGAADVLGQLQDRASVEPLLRLVEDPEPRVRIAAACALGRLGDPRAVEPLLRLRKRTRSMRRRHLIGQALETLGWRPPSPTHSANLERLVDRSAWPELVQIGSPAVAVLLKTTRDPEYFVRRNAIVALGKIGDRAAVGDLLRHLEAKILGVRMAAAVALGRIGDRRAVKPLVRMLEKEREPKVRGAAARALADIGDRKVVPHLLVLIAPGRGSKKDLELRSVAAAALDTLRFRPRSAKRRVALRVAAADWDGLSAMGGEAVPALLTALGSEPEVVQLEIAGVLGAIGDPTAAAPVMEWLFERPCSIFGRKELKPRVAAMTGLFGDYTDMLLRVACCVTRKKTDRSTAYADDYDWAYDLRMSNAGVRALCAVDGDVAVYILHRVARKQDVEVVLSFKDTEWGGHPTNGTLSFARQRARAEEELERRGSPNAKVSSLRKRGAFRLSQ